MSFIKKIKKIISGRKAIVLMYHRVGDLYIDPWDLAVSEENFESQIVLLKRTYNVIKVKDLITRLNTNCLHRKTICITFDDGYQDNFLKAQLILKRYNCPATFFITTGFTGHHKIFWWDILTNIFLLTPKLPSTLKFKAFDFILENNGEITGQQLALHKLWKWPAPPPTQRCAIYLSIWEYIKPLGVEEIKEVIDYLINWSGIKQEAKTEDYPMTNDHLKQLSSNQLFSLGVHTVNHPALGAQTMEVQQNELVTARNHLYKHFGNYTDAVAYPYGHYNDQTIKIMKNENFEAGFTTEERAVNNKSDIYRIGRFQVKNWTGMELKEQLLKWRSQ